jgi:hypothetical protein
MARSPEDRRKFLRGLDDTESVLLVFYKYLLYVLIPSVTVLAAVFFRSVSNDSFRDFLRIYGGILYLIFLAWAVGQLFAIRNRQSRGPSGWNTPSPGDPKVEMKFSKDPETGARGFSFHFGLGTPGSSSSTKIMRIGLSASSVAEEDKLDDAALVQADACVMAGSGLDMVCRLLNPRYRTGVLPNSRSTGPILKASLSCDAQQVLRWTRVSLRHRRVKVLQFRSRPLKLAPATGNDPLRVVWRLQKIKEAKSRGHPQTQRR